MSDKYPMTPAGRDRLKRVLKKMKEVDRPAISKAIEVARGHGDLSENADYDAAKEEQGMIEAKIRDAEGRLSLAEVIDPTTLSGDTVRFGATVTIVDLESDEEKTYTIVGDHEADIKRRRISISSPVARALIARSVGDETKIRAPGGEREVEITSVSWLQVDE